MKNQLKKLLLILCIIVFSVANQAVGQTRNTSKRDQSLKRQANKQSRTSQATLAAEPVSAEDMSLKNQTKEVKVAAKSIENIVKNSEDLTVAKPNGNINWTQQYIEAVGQSVIDNERFKNVAQARLMATRGAVVIAQRNLLEIVKGVDIVGETTVQDMITTSDFVYSKVEGVVKGAKQVGKATENEGVIEVRLRMPIYGKESLASTVDEETMTAAKSKRGYEAAPELLKQETETGVGIDGSKPIVFNVANGDVKDPAMFPIIIDDNGKVLFDFSTMYKLKDGAFPKYLQMGKDILQAMGNQKAVDVINMIQTRKGEFKIPENSTKKVFWNKVAKVAQDVGAVLFKLIF